MQQSAKAQADQVVATLRRLGSQKVREGMARFAIPSDNAFGVPVGTIRDLGKKLGRSHELAAALWETGGYEARLLTAFVDEPQRVTPAQMDRWCGAFDNWAVCDTLCFHLFDRTPHAWEKVAEWSGAAGEFAKRAAFALLWGLTVHDKRSGDEPFLRCLPLIERAANDERNFVKKAVNMALRALGKRSPALNVAATAAARRLAESSDRTARWVGKDALRELVPAAARLASRCGARKSPAASSPKKKIASRGVPRVSSRPKGGR